VIDTQQWLTKIAEDEFLAATDLLAALAMVSDTHEADLTTEETEEATFRLQLAGYLWPVAVEGNRWTYRPRIPGAVAA